MTEYEKYLFDLNGYLVIDEILSPEQLTAFNAAIDHHRPTDDRLPPRSLDGGSEALRGQHGREIFNGLNWDEPWCRPFRDLIALPTALRYMVDTIGDDLRFESFTGIANSAGSEGQLLHGGGIPHSPDLEQGFFHRVENGRMRNGLMAIAYLLSDVDENDGGFCCIPGSHKANFFCSWEMRRLEIGAEFVRQIPASAGSAILFTEALTHGALPWNGTHERRIVIARYNPGIMSFAPPAAPETLEEIAALSPLHQALLKPPSFPERSNIPALLDEQK